MNELSLFTGMGGGIYGSMILGWKTLAYVEKNKHRQKIIAQRIADGWFDRGDIYGDIKDFNEKHASDYAGQVDVLTGGFPCQPFSVAGKRKGTSDERYLFNEIIKTIEIVRPARLFFENVPGLLNDPAIIEIYRKLEAVGYITKAPLLLGSDDCGGIHRRKRLWIYAVNPYSKRDASRYKEISGTNEEIPQRHESAECNHTTKSIQDTNTRCKRVQGIEQKPVQRKREIQRGKDIRKIEDLFNRPDIPTPLFCGMDDEFPNWRKQLKAIGNGQDPIVMATAYKILSEMT